MLHFQPQKRRPWRSALSPQPQLLLWLHLQLQLLLNWLLLRLQLLLLRLLQLQLQLQLRLHAQLRLQLRLHAQLRLQLKLIKLIQMILAKCECSNRHLINKKTKNEAGGILRFYLTILLIQIFYDHNTLIFNKTIFTFSCNCPYALKRICLQPAHFCLL